ncbi:MAG: hypothetical protein HOW73_47650 [Polyangiaceae bacterium]|nr:hypothetical protein [Polyangiaceae bacterium]
MTPEHRRKVRRKLHLPKAHRVGCACDICRHAAEYAAKLGWRLKQEASGKRQYIESDGSSFTADQRLYAAMRRFEREAPALKESDPKRDALRASLHVARAEADKAWERERPAAR